MNYEEFLNAYDKTKTLEEKFALIENLAKEKGLTVKYTDDIDENRLDSLWYGGEVARVTDREGFVITLEARGDIEASYNHTADLADTDYADIEVEDRNNSCGFRAELGQYIASDEQLEKAIYEGRLCFDYINWWEYNCENVGKRYCALEWNVSGESDLFIALADILLNFAEFKENFLAEINDKD